MGKVSGIKRTDLLAGTILVSRKQESRKPEVQANCSNHSTTNLISFIHRFSPELSRLIIALPTKWAATGCPLSSIGDSMKDTMELSKG